MFSGSLVDSASILLNMTNFNGGYKMQNVQTKTSGARGNPPPRPSTPPSQQCSVNEGPSFLRTQLLTPFLV